MVHDCQSEREKSYFSEVFDNLVLKGGENRNLENTIVNCIAITQLVNDISQTAKSCTLNYMPGDATDKINVGFEFETK